MRFSRGVGMDRNEHVGLRRARLRAALRCSGMNTSLSRVEVGLHARASALIWRASSRAIARVTSFSRLPARPERARILAAVAGVDRDHQRTHAAAAHHVLHGLTHRAAGSQPGRDGRRVRAARHAGGRWLLGVRRRWRAGRCRDTLRRHGGGTVDVGDDAAWHRRHAGRACGAGDDPAALRPQSDGRDVDHAGVAAAAVAGRCGQRWRGGIGASRARVADVARRDSTIARPFQHQRGPSALGSMRGFSTATGCARSNTMRSGVRGRAGRCARTATTPVGGRQREARRTALDAGRSTHQAVGVGQAE